MGKKVETETTSRRDFLKLATTVAPAAAAAAVIAPEEAAAAPEPRSGCLQDSAHIRNYYDSARF